MEAQLIYFDELGIYQGDAILQLTERERNGQYYNIDERIKYLSSKKSLPGIAGDILGDNNFVVVLQEDVGYPILVKNESININKKRWKITSHQYADDTKHIQTIYRFKENGKFYSEEKVILSEYCVIDNKALTYEIIDQVLEKYPNTDGYIMICPPPDGLEGVPYLITPIEYK